VVTLDRPYNAGEIFTLTIVYSGHGESAGFGAIDFTTTLGGIPIAYTLSEPYFAHLWWPAKDGDVAASGNNSDKFTLEMAVVAPAAMTTASNGLLVGVDELPENRKRHRWSSDYPIATYLVCFSTTLYNSWQETYHTQSGGTMPVLFYIYPELDTPSRRALWSKATRMLPVFSELFGEYPFVNEKYGIYACEFGGGMEHQTFTAQGSFHEWLTAHELAHQWWGDMVTCKTWNDIWLNEGFASYSEALWFEHHPDGGGPAALQAYMEDMKYFGDGTVYVQDDELDTVWQIFDGDTSYDKGAWVLHMLRHVLGDEAFFDTLRAYRAAFEYSAAGTADCQAVCEATFGGSLDWFFSEWIHGSRYPSYEYGWRSVEVNGRHYLLEDIDQVQDTDYQRFTMPLDVVADGRTYVVFNDHDPEHFVIPVPGPVDSVGLDPDNWVMWRDRDLHSYVPGPPTIVETSPAPGAAIGPAAGVHAVSITFHTPVNASASDFALAGATIGALSASFSITADANTVTLSTDPLPPDTYTVTVSDTLTAVESGRALDGEIGEPAVLPSGDGVPGGDAVFTFTITAPVAGDLNGDGDVDIDDYTMLADCVTGPSGGLLAGCGFADLDGDADVDLADLETFTRVFGVE
jgi:hypothetical protein